MLQWQGPSFALSWRCFSANKINKSGHKQSVYYLWQVVLIKFFSDLAAERGEFLIDWVPGESPNRLEKFVVIGVNTASAHSNLALKVWSCIAEIGKETLGSNHLDHFSCFCFKKWTKKRIFLKLFRINESRNTFYE